MSDTLNRLHDLRCLSQDLRRAVEKERAWQVSVHLAACENELTEAIAFVNLCDEARAAAAEQPSVYVCVSCSAAYSKPQIMCPVCGSRRVVKSPAVTTLANKTNAS